MFFAINWGVIFSLKAIEFTRYLKKNCYKDPNQDIEEVYIKKEQKRLRETRIKEEKKDSSENKTRRYPNQMSEEEFNKIFEEAKVERYVPKKPRIISQFNSSSPIKRKKVF